MKTIYSLMIVLLLTACAKQPAGNWSEIPEHPHWSHAPSEYAVGILTAPTPFDVEAAIARQDSPILSASDIDGLAAAYAADPFLIEHDGRWYIFYELLRASPRRGSIAWAESEDGQNWQHAGEAVVEPFHLSFPNVFEWEGDYYMVLESNEAGQIRLYKADTFPGEWSFAAVLIEGVWVDNSILHYNNHWWLFTSPHHSRDLHLFHSADLTHGWTEHAASPVVRNDIRRARMAGRAFEYDGRLWRIAMDCGPRYGHATRVMEITDLTRTSYAEREAPESPLIEAGMYPWTGLGMHHYDLRPYRDGDEAWLMVVDGNTRVQPETTLEVKFADGSLLLGATQRPRNIPAGDPILLRLFWKNLPEHDRAQVFVHFVQNGQVIFQGDHELTDRPETYDLFIPVPADMPAGKVEVRLGLHTPKQGRMATRSTYPTSRHAVTLPITFNVVR